MQYDHSNHDDLSSSQCEIEILYMLGCILLYRILNAIFQLYGFRSLIFEGILGVFFRLVVVLLVLLRTGPDVASLGFINRILVFFKMV